MARSVLYTAAHGGFAGQPIPLGGGAAVCNMLTDEWSRTHPFSFQVLGPAILGDLAPTGAELVRFSEMRYARFCRQFEKACSEEVLRHDPKTTVVLANDISEGPDFRTLQERGFPIYTIYHVDVVAYVAAMYGKGLLKPETLVRWWDRLDLVLPMPDVLKLVFEKQKRSVVHSRGLIVPSEGMREILERCYPKEARGKVHVMPWGVPAAVAHDEAAALAEAGRLREQYAIEPGTKVLLALSRISPEKGQDLLLEALQSWKGPELRVFICGGAAYMQGELHLRKLQKLARTLPAHVQVAFPGHVTGIRKQGFFSLADLYVFPSRHESYGLTLLEALQAGLPAVCFDHSGAQTVMRPEFGIMAQSGSTGSLRKSIQELLADDHRRKEMGKAAREYARSQAFSASAARLSALLLS